jgi:hypothetical protein
LDGLELFHQMTVQAKTTMYDFYTVLEKLTDNVGNKPEDRYHEWIRMCKEYRHLMMCKRGGRAVAYDPTGIAGTKSGELAVKCPACPRPGVNLPEGWENASEADRWLSFWRDSRTWADRAALFKQVLVCVYPGVGRMLST